jgi:hypothetical protein
MVALAEPEAPIPGRSGRTSFALGFLGLDFEAGTFSSRFHPRLQLKKKVSNTCLEENLEFKT